MPKNYFKWALSLIAGINDKSYKYFCKIFLLSSIIVEEPLPPPVDFVFTPDMMLEKSVTLF